MVNYAKTLNDIREKRLGLSMDAFAKMLGYKHASSVQRYLGPEFETQPLPDKFLIKLILNVVGKGQPEIKQSELYELANEAFRLHISQEGKSETGITPDSKSRYDITKSLLNEFLPNAVVQGKLRGRSELIPVYGHAVAGVDGEFVMNGNLLYEALTPPGLSITKGAYAIIVSGDSMSPKFEDGDIAYVDPTYRVSRGNYVVAQVQIEEDGPHLAFIKRFVKHNSNELVLEQFNPAKELKFAHSQVVAVHYITLSGASN